MSNVKRVIIEAENNVRVVLVGTGFYQGQEIAVHDQKRGTSGTFGHVRTGNPAITGIRSDNGLLSIEPDFLTGISADDGEIT